MPPVISSEKCTGCGTCATICNSHILSFDRDTDAIPLVKFPEECWHCDSCVLDCPTQAITLRLPLAFSLLHVPAKTLVRKEVAHDIR